MKLAVLHYHLNRGGVTRVIANHLKALSISNAPIQHALVICGGRADDWPDTPDSKGEPIRITRVNLPLLEYDHLTSTPPEPKGGQLADAIESVLRRHDFTKDDSILHIHNHALGKNLALPDAIVQLAARGHRFLLQIHDFIEDHRPAAYQSLGRSLGSKIPIGQYLYPQASHIHYAVLNGRDYDAMEKAGLDRARLHFLPNPVEEFTAIPDQSTARHKLESRYPVKQRLVLYPVRGIRRKNVGELLLWAAVSGDDTSYAQSLAPQNPAERTSYDAWVEHAKRLGLPVLFDTGGDGKLSFSENLAACDALITTSVAEGFGMVFLESWLAGRPLIGRDIPQITADFRRSGLDLGQLSPDLLVPLDWLDRRVVRRELVASFRELLQAYGYAAERLMPAVDQLLECDSIDFASLTPTLQAKIIEDCWSDKHLCADLLALNPWFVAACAANTTNCNDLIVANAEAVRTNYGPIAVGQRLQRTYAALASSSPTVVTYLPGDESIVHSCLDVTHLHPIRFA